MQPHPLYADFDAEKSPSDRVSLCVECAKDAALRRFIERHAVQGPVCGVCHRTNAPYDACDPAMKPALASLLKALIRFHFHEYEYNPHWGGEYSPVTLLVQPNLILESESLGAIQRSREQSEPFLEEYFAEPYPDPDKGISIYAGHDAEGMRHIVFSLKQTESTTLKELRTRLENENPCDVEPAVLALLEKIGSRLEHIVPAATRYARARIGVAGRYQKLGTGEWHPEIVTLPFQGAAIGAPPPPRARAGRLNRTGVAFLYLASDAETAIAEVRPHPGHLVSIGQFDSAKTLRLASLDADIADFALNETELALFHFIYSTGLLMSLPVVPGDERTYVVTQLVADCLRRHGYDGVIFKSSVARGKNICAFEDKSFAYVDASAQVSKVRSLTYGCDPEPMVLAPGENEWPLQ